jgi:hypothetical protein
MTDATLDHLRRDALEKRVSNIGGNRILWSAKDTARIRDHVMSAPEKVFRDLPVVARNPGVTSIAAARRKFSEVVRDVRENDLDFAFIISSSCVDLAGDVIIPTGIDFSDFLKNSCVLNSHDSAAMPIAVSTRPAIAGTSATAVAKFPAAGVSECSDKVAAALRAGLVRGASVGFQPLRWKFATQSDRPFGVDFLEIRLLEWSICSVPCNPECLMIGAVGGKSVSRHRLNVPTLRSGRSISGANEALLREAMDHHASATKCIQDVLDGNAPLEDDPDDGENPIVDDEAAKARLEERRREARAIAASARSFAASSSDNPPPTREQRLAEARGFRRAVMDVDE